MDQTDSSLPISQHFQLERLAQGVYAAIAIKGGAAFSNAGIIDLGDHTLIFDTFETPLAAKDLRAAAEQLAGRPASFVIISHAHPDHWLGNQVFADHAPIIATHEIRESMSDHTAYIEGMKKDPSEFEEMIRADQERLTAETDQDTRAALEHSIARWRFMLGALPTLEIRLPNQTFDGKLVFYGTQRKAELMTWGVGHTPSDCFLVLPEENIAFLGDLAFFQSQPFMAHCDPAAWVAQMEKWEGSDLKTFVPGHGPLGTKADIALQRRYIIELEKWVAQRIEAGVPVEEAIQQSLPEPFDAWTRGSARSEANIRFLYQRLSEKGKDQL